MDVREALLAKRYFQPGEDFDAFVLRLANFAAQGDRIHGVPERRALQLAEEYARLKYENLFWENSPYLFNAGTDSPMLSACYVLDVPDDMFGIFTAVRDSVMIQKYGGGVGFDFSKLRPEGDVVNGTGGVASGPLSFLKAFDAATEAVKQGGRRRGANMGILRCDHPDIFKFINAKLEEGVITNFNLSVGVTDAFMEAALNNKLYPLINPRTGEVVKTVDALSVLHMIAKNAWRNGEPGVIFLDAINRANMVPHLGMITATNPCQPLWAPVLTPSGIRKIGDIKVGDVIWSGKRWTRVVNKVITGVKPVYAFRTTAGTFYGTKDHKVVSNGQKLEVGEAKTIDICPPPDGFEDLQPFSKGTAEIIEVEHLGDELVCDITVDDPDHVYWTGGLLVSNCGERPLLPNESCNLGSVNLEAHVKGDDWDFAKLAETVRLAVRILDNTIDLNKYPNRRIEKATKKTRKIGLGVMGFHAALIRLGIPYDSGRAEREAARVMSYIYEVARSESEKLAIERGVFPAWEGSVWEKRGVKIRNAEITCIAPTGSISRLARTTSGIEPLFALEYESNILDGKYTERLPVVEQAFRKGVNRELLKTALEIPYQRHIGIQAAFQNNGVDAAVSKTINMSYNSTEGDVLAAIIMAWEKGCKGITIYRDRSRQAQVLEVEKCPECGVTLINESGCYTCPACGWGKCSIA